MEGTFKSSSLPRHPVIPPEKVFEAHFEDPVIPSQQVFGCL